MRPQLGSPAFSFPLTPDSRVNPRHTPSYTSTSPPLPTYACIIAAATSIHNAKPIVKA